MKMVFQLFASEGMKSLVQYHFTYTGVDLPVTQKRSFNQLSEAATTPMNKIMIW